MNELISERVKESIERVEALASAAGAGRYSGTLVAIGDSWFDYPKNDIVKALEKYGYSVENLSRYGDTLQSMTYAEGHLDRLTRRLCDLKGKNIRPKSVIISGGGNDLVKKLGSENGDNVLATLLNQNGSNLPVLNENSVNALNNNFSETFSDLVDIIICLIDRFFGKESNIPIFLHGYGYAVPDGRPVTYFIVESDYGPWLRPAFEFRGYNNWTRNVDDMEDLVNRFNEMVEEVASKFKRNGVQYVDLRGKISNDIRRENYQNYWDNELHPRDEVFDNIAQIFVARIENLDELPEKPGNGQMVPEF